jgi:Zinc carboxypeptidase/Cytosolic carboxypeptidase N-terminal domain
MKCTLGSFDFCSNFDSGNLDKVNLVPLDKGSASTLFGRQSLLDFHLQLWTASDGPQDNPSKNRTWFHFYITHSLNQDATVLMQFMNLNRVQRLFNQGLRPLFRYEGHKTWRRVPSRPETKNADGCMEMSFQFVFQATNKKVFFSYCLPYSYEKLQAHLMGLEGQFMRVGNNQICSRIPKPARLADIYFHRDVLAKSYEGNNLDILTISSFDELSIGYESHPFPNPGQRSRLFSMKAKKFFFLTARVHPAETISSYMLDGLIDFLLGSDPRAALLRKSYVFKIIPMLNPDGVIGGNYRGDHTGMNLNRVYNSPDPVLHPTIHATKTYLSYTMTLGKLGYYIDLHGHANKPGSFLFGNWIEDLTLQYEMLLFTKYLALHNPLFVYDECDFGPSKVVPSHIPGSELEQTKDGTSRLAIYKLTSCPRIFTFEANYYGYKHKNQSKRFVIEDFQMMGRSIGLAAFDATFGNHSLVSVDESEEQVQEWIQEKILGIYEKAGVLMPSLIGKFCNKL